MGLLCKISPRVSVRIPLIGINLLYCLSISFLYGSLRYHQKPSDAIALTKILDKGFISFPPTTDDNYMHFFIGYSDGKRAVDNAPHNELRDKCPSGHTQEYCAGYTSGVNQESYLFHDAYVGLCQWARGKS
ncbi:MAG TPA: hypothetical protein VEL11_03425 [Candidatus Bathyarchaeia archaeon]|nr:hypothetical protein [Candidatus Bathyarchaeia archaeon]